MNLIQSLKERYGLSQYQLAELTGVSRSHISLNALEMRDLPSPATDALIALHEAFDTLTPLEELSEIGSELRAANQFLAGELELHATDCLERADDLERTYRQMSLEINQAWRRLHGLRVFRTGFVPVRRNGDLFLQILEDRVDTFLNPQRLLKAEMLRLEVEMLRQEAANARKRALELKNL